MGETKFPILDGDFLLKMLGACNDDEERGLFLALYYSGMHISSVRTAKIVRRGDKRYIVWVRPKTNRTLDQVVPLKHVPIIETFYRDYRRKSDREYGRIIKSIGARAGYDDISPMTIRHTRCIRAIKEGHNPWTVPQIMGCTPDVVFRNYSKLHEDQLEDEKTKKEG